MISSSGTRSGRIPSWSPAIDVHETYKEFIVNTELSGLSKDQINVDVRDNALVISGETKQDERYKEGNTHIQERRYGSFNHRIYLPPNVKPDGITAKFENGLNFLRPLLPARKLKYNKGYSSVVVTRNNGSFTILSIVYLILLLTCVL